MQVRTLEERISSLARAKEAAADASATELHEAVAAVREEAQQEATMHEAVAAMAKEAAVHQAREAAQAAAAAQCRQVAAAVASAAHTERTALATEMALFARTLRQEAALVARERWQGALDYEKAPAQACALAPHEVACSRPELKVRASVASAAEQPLHTRTPTPTLTMPTAPLPPPPTAPPPPPTALPAPTAPLSLLTVPRARDPTGGAQHLCLARGWARWARWAALVSRREAQRSRERAAVAHALARRRARGWHAWRGFALDLHAYLQVASFQFSHVVVRRPELEPRGEALEGLGQLPHLRRVWHCTRREKQDWALLHASQLGHLATVRALLWRGAVVGVVDGLGQTALHAASFEGHADIVRALLAPRAGARLEAALEARDAHGHTALMLASLRGHLRVMKLLIEAGADDGALWVVVEGAREGSHEGARVGAAAAEHDKDEEPEWLRSAGKDVGVMRSAAARARSDRAADEDDERDAAAATPRDALPKSPPSQLALSEGSVHVR